MNVLYLSLALPHIENKVAYLELYTVFTNEHVHTRLLSLAVLDLARIEVKRLSREDGSK